MQQAVFEAAVELIRQRDARYAADAYEFVRKALERTTALTRKNTPARQRHVTGQQLRKTALTRKNTPERHVTGQQLLEGIRTYALSRFGPMAATVFEAWGIRACPDFGEIVFNLIDQGLLSKTEQDSRADFAPGYDFADAFQKPFLPSSKLPPPRRGDKPATAFNLGSLQ